MKKIYTLGIVILFAFILIPQIALASWWNPFSWNIFTFWKAEKSVVVNETQINNQIDSIATPTESQKGTDMDSQPDSQSIISNRNTPDKKETNVTHDPRSALISDFLKNPTLENFKTFCISAKNVDGKTTKQVLDSNRENMVDVKLSLYEEIKPCHPDDRTVLLPLDNNLLVTLEGNDSDEIREGKILFNDKIKSLMNTSKVKFISFEIEEVNNKQARNPKDLFKFYSEILKNLGEESKDKSNIFILEQKIIRAKIKEGGDIDDLSNYFK